MLSTTPCAVPSGAALCVLFRRTHEDFIDRDMARARYNVRNCVGDIISLQAFDVVEALPDQLLNFRPVVRSELRRDGSRFDE
jgi:hypothetical protein